jgi:hypothetical protein
VDRSERIKTLVVWGVTLGLLAYMAWTTDIDRFLETLRAVSPLALLGITLTEVLVTWLYDSFTLSVLFSRFHGRVTFREMLPIKGASYILNVINYNAATVAISFFLRDRKKVPFFDSFGSLMYLNGIDLVAMGLLMGLGFALAPSHVDSASASLVSWLVPLLVVGLALNIVFWRFEPRMSFLHGLTRRSLFSALRRARLSDYAVMIGLRFGMILIYLSAIVLLLWLFDIEISIPAAMVYYPMIVFIGVLPVSVAGYGTTQVASRYLYGTYVLARGGGLFLPAAGLFAVAAFLPDGGLGGGLVQGHAALLAEATTADAVIDAFTTSMLTCFLLWRVLVGLLCLPGVRDLRDAVAKHDA